MNKKTRLILMLLLCFSFVLSACSGGTAVGNSSITTPINEQVTYDEQTNAAIPYEYRAIIENIIAAFPWNDDDLTMVPENPELSYMYRRNAELSEIGFSIIDLDSNGNSELILADAGKNFIYDLYTSSDGKALHLIDSGERYRHYLYENGYIENMWSGSAAATGHDFYKLTDGSLDFIERITLDAYHALDIGLINDLIEANATNFFFRSESEDPKDYKPIPEAEAISAIAAYKSAHKPLTIEYTLLSEYKK